MSFRLLSARARLPSKFTSQRRLGWLGLGLVSLLGCDKLALSENLTRVGNGGPMGSPSDAGPGGFKPTPQLDASTPDAGARDDGGSDGPLCGMHPATDVPFSKQALLDSFAKCAVVQYCQFDRLAVDLAAKTQVYAESPNEQTLLAAKTAWYFAMQEWQLAELFRFGPAASAMELGGQNLRDKIYVYPNSSRCSAEEQIARESYLGDLEALPTSARGLSTLEFLLFSSDTANQCSRYSVLNYPAPGTWAALSAEDIVSRKRAFVRALGDDVRKQSQALISAWDAQGGDFERALLSAGQGSKVFASEQQALNAVSNAMFYMDKELKDWKVARPAGFGDCSSNCPVTAETLYAKIGSDNVRANLKGFRLLFQGCGDNYAGLGFDDWLRAVGVGDIADEMLAALDGADEALASFDLDQAFSSNPASVEPVYAALKAISDILKADVITALNLERPMSAEGDND
jgi:predicted lipoprotein